MAVICTVCLVPVTVEQRGRCNREKPPCKYFHPPQHLKDQLLINGRNHLALKNALMQQMGLTPPGQALIPGQVPAVVSLSSDSFFWFMVLPSFFCVSYLPAEVAWAIVGGKLQFATPLTLGQPLMATSPYLTGMPQVGSTFSPYFTPGPVMPTILGPDPTSQLSVVPQSVVAQQKMARSDRLEDMTLPCPCVPSMQVLTILCFPDPVSPSKCSALALGCSCSLASFVCREFQRGACKRAESECRFAHPPDTVTANEDGTVTVCMDAVKGRCNRDPCRYFHPPLHLQAHIKAAQCRSSPVGISRSPRALLLSPSCFCLVPN
uniref:C3H1-type domain-containing protein n=1 Tax=Timema bartmani TaxID=61472 RepID=A0A7R9HYS9_9NEOP|nr:unnamed protein product [Timema bartmani]